MDRPDYRWRMTLEDHLGDVLRKARAMNQVSAAQAAAAAGLCEAELAALEETGNVTKRPNFQALAQALQLHGAKLERLAAGWLPSPKDLSACLELRVFNTDSGGRAVNAYLVCDEVSRDAALFDTCW